jgi:hypothetical protein
MGSGVNTSIVFLTQYIPVMYIVSIKQMEWHMNTGINFDIMYELACGRVLVITPPFDGGQNKTYYWVSDNGNLIQCDKTCHCVRVMSVRIPWGKGYRFSVKDREYKNVITNH